MAIEEHSHKPEDTVITQAHFPCEQCGADLKFSPKTQNLECSYCGHQSPIPISNEPIREYDFESAVRELARLQREPKQPIAITQCSSCGAQFSMQENEHAGNCPYCASAVVAGTSHARYIKPRSLLPFLISQEQAVEIFDQWIGSRWFAPSSLKKHSKRDERLTGIFLPYWTYDSDTSNYYHGQRGTVYFDQQVFTTVINGRPVRQVQTVPRVRWRPASGHVRLHFDDVLIGATKTLPRAIIDRLHPWDLENLVPYTEAYLSGFRSEIYQITVDQGFLQAENVMRHQINQAIRRDIGGDQQRIANVNTTHDDTTFKHLLLPVWSAAFKYRGKTYRYVVNGRNGQIQGERPYSWLKIGLAAIAGGAILFSALYIMGNKAQIRSNFPTNLPYNFPQNFPQELPQGFPRFEIPGNRHSVDPFEEDRYRQPRQQQQPDRQQKLPENRSGNNVEDDNYRSPLDDFIERQQRLN